MDLDEIFMFVLGVIGVIAAIAFVILIATHPTCNSMGCV